MAASRRLARAQWCQDDVNTWRRLIPAGSALWKSITRLIHDTLAGLLRNSGTRLIALARRIARLVIFVDCVSRER